MMRKLLPAPLLSLALLVMWLLLVRSYTLGQVLLGALAGWAMPWFFASLRPHRPRIRRPLVLALDTLYAIGMLIVLVAGIRYASQMYFEAALLIALFGFVGTAAMAKFLLRGEVIE